MIKRMRGLSLGLAVTLLLTQNVQAATFITPFGETVETADQTVTDQETKKNPGPGEEKTETTGTVQVSAVYSTKPAAEDTADKKEVTIDKTAADTVAVPEISSGGAVLYDASHQIFLYEKNADTKYFPASITKLLTALLVLENANLDDTVTFSKNAVTNLESGAVTLNLREGDKVSVKDCLYGLLLKSANEVANGLAEHVGGSISGFAVMMNEKAKALGCTGSNFVNPNGLNDPNHYTTAHDMALIAKAAFENEKLCEIASTTSYKFPATKAAGVRTIAMGHKMLYSGDSRYYEGIVGGKTGYTSLAGNTLATCAEKDGVRMIAVILKSSSTHYTDTKSLLDYGYALNAAGAIKAVENEPVKNETAEAEKNMSGGPGMVYKENTTDSCPRWIADGSDWRFELADGTRLSNCFVSIDEKEYAFDAEGKMLTGWLMLGNNWHFFGSSGAMIKSDWRKDGDYWFYLGADGAMVRNSWIDDQYYVGEDGVWIQ